MFASTSQLESAPSQSTLERALPLIATWLCAFAIVLAGLWSLAMLYDGDSYYHLAIARAYVEHGLLQHLPWARFSVMHEAFGDKELLFHVLLMPAAALRDPVLGAKLTLAALAATILTSYARLTLRAAGPIGLVLPALVLLGSQSFALRVIRLRPELLALLLLLWTVHALSERRTWLAGACACAFALGYTAIHALLGICGLCFVVLWWLERKPSWGLVGKPALGALAGLLLHPSFPHNLHIFYLQNVEFWRHQRDADVGNEILPLGVSTWLRYDWPLLLGCLILAASLRRTHALDRRTRHVALVQCAAALPFVLLFVHSARFALYAVPLGLLALTWIARLRGYAPDARVWLRGQAGPRSWLVLLLLACGSLPITVAALRDEMARSGCEAPYLRNQLAALSRALPSGAKVAAPWTISEDYMYFAPQAHYLNVLDPLFMRSAHPHAYEAQRALFAGEQPDVPLILQAELDSDFLAFYGRMHLALQDQLAGDPRLEQRVPHGQVLYEVVPERARAFVRDFRVAASRAGLLQPTAARYPRHASATGRRIEGMIDAARLTGAMRPVAGCSWFSPVPTAEHAAPGDYEIASTAPLRLWIDDRVQLELAGSQRLLPGRGHRLPSISLGQVTVELCAPASTDAKFYLLRRD
jgi:hypothetical protein